MPGSAPAALNKRKHFRDRVHLHSLLPGTSAQAQRCTGAGDAGGRPPVTVGVCLQQDVTDTEACGLPPAPGHSSAGALAPQALTHQEKEGGDRNVPAGGDRHVSPSPAGGLLPEHTVTSVVQTPAFRRG